jgi:hypothetical protein
MLLLLSSCLLCFFLVIVASRERELRLCLLLAHLLLVVADAPRLFMWSVPLLQSINNAGIESLLLCAPSNQCKSFALSS